MNQIKKQMKLKKGEYYQTHLSLVNCVLPVKLTPMEIKVLASFMSLTGDIAKDRFGTTAKKMVKEDLSITSAGMSNYLRSLKDKGFLLESKDGTLTILPILFPQKEEQVYMFKLINSECY